jgi:hypothetical protein
MTPTQMTADRAARTATASSRAGNTPARQIGLVNREPVARAASIGGIAQSCSDQGQAEVLRSRVQGASRATAGPASDVVSRSR